MLFLNSWRVSVVPYYVTILPLQLFKNSIDIEEKLRLNLHSLSVSVSERLEYGHKWSQHSNNRLFCPYMVISNKETIGNLTLFNIFLVNLEITLFGLTDIPGRISWLF